MEQPAVRDLLEFALEAAHAAGRLTLGYFQAGTVHESKADESPVTIADRSAEQLLRERIAARYPAHTIIGEEYGERAGDPQARWILDPIDGTVSFVHGVPIYSVLVGFEWRGDMLIGVIHMPALSETVYAARGTGCHWNGRRARVSQTATMAGAMVLTGGGKYFERNGRDAEFDRLRRAGKQHRSWCDAYGYALVATGRADAIADPAMALWDIAPLVPCIEEAGGRITDWQGRATHLAREAAATNGRLHDELLGLLRPRG